MRPTALLAVVLALLPTLAFSCLTCKCEPLPDGTCCCVHPGCPPVPPSCPPAPPHNNSATTGGDEWRRDGSGLWRQIASSVSHANSVRNSLVNPAEHSGQPAASSTLEQQWTEWQRQHRARYQSPEEARERRRHFELNSATIAARDAESPRARFATDQFADRSPEELLAMRGGAEPVFPKAEIQPRFTKEAVQAAVAAGPIDWVERGAVNKPISQGRCGTCAQFSATANIEAQWHLHGHPLVYLSTQEMIDCSSYTGPYGMGWVAAIKKGIALASDYPLANHSDPTLKGCRSPCNMTAANKSFAHIDGATCTMGRGPGGANADEAQVLAWLQHGPLSISIAAGNLNGCESPR